MPLTRRITLGTRRLALIIDRWPDLPKRAPVNVRATWLDGPDLEDEQHDVARDEAQRLKAAARWTADLGLRLGEVLA